jgi:streptogramin lyase
VAIEPSAVIDAPDSSGNIALTTDGKSVWAAVDGAIVRINAATNAATRLKAPVQSDDTTLAIAGDGLWATRWEGGRLYRLDPNTGSVVLSVDMPRAVRIAFVGEDLWVGREDVGHMLHVDRSTGDTGTMLSQGAYGTAGAGDLWFAPGGSPTILRVDPSTGEATATIAAPGESNCGISGMFPDGAWTGCFGREIEPRSAARIDPATNSVVAVVRLPPSHGVSGVFVLDGETWVVAAFEEADGTPFAGLLRVDPATGTIERFLSLRGVDPDFPVVAGGAIWIPDEAGHRIVRVDAAELSG